MSAPEILLLWPTLVVQRHVELPDVGVRAARSPTLAEVLDDAALEACEAQMASALEPLGVGPLAGSVVPGSVVERVGPDDWPAPRYHSGEWHGVLCLVHRSAEEETSRREGELMLFDPRPGALVAEHPGRPFGRSLRLDLGEGSLVLMPGWLAWSVLPVTTGRELIVAHLVS